MKWWQIMLCVLTMLPFVIMFVIGVIIEPIQENRAYKKKYNQWNKTHPELQRRLCKTCKYSISETHFEGRYPHGIPHRQVCYCTYFHRGISDRQKRCIAAEPTEYFYERIDAKEPQPKDGTNIYYSAYGNCYHSSPNCRMIKTSRNIYTGSTFISERYPCPKCWKEEDGKLIPKN